MDGSIWGSTPTAVMLRFASVGADVLIGPQSCGVEQAYRGAEMLPPVRRGRRPRRPARGNWRFFSAPGRMREPASCRRAVGDARPYGRDKPVLRRGGYQPPAGPDPVQAYHGVQTFPSVVGDGALDVPRICDAVHSSPDAEMSPPVRRGRLFCLDGYIPDAFL